MGRGSWLVLALLRLWIVGRGSRIRDMGYGWLCSVVLGCGWLCSVVVDCWLCWVANSWYELRVTGGMLLDRWLCWVANSWYGLRVVVDCWLCPVVLGCGWLFWFLGWRDMVLGGCFAVVLVFGFSDGETETRDERQRRESQIKYYYFFTILATVQFYV